jgi:hypothetical protein
VKRVVRVLAVVAAATALASCSHDGRTLRPAGPDQTLSIASSSTTVAATTAPAKNAGADTAGLTVTAPWPDNGIIDAKYTCKGVGVSPAISWSGVPAKTKELALSLVDLDANDFVHWVVAGLDPASTGIVEGKVPAGATQAINGFGKAGRAPPTASTPTCSRSMPCRRRRASSPRCKEPPPSPRWTPTRSRASR